jgi:tRNA threonylcarbamoyladenosine biosynthesis protein TsaB
MALLLNLETATTNCSVSLAKDGVVIAIKEHDTPNYSHSEQLHVFIEEVLTEASVKLSDLDAVAVSKGPGSYTGLRIGVSAAKGLCFSLDVPLISIETLKSMASQYKSSDHDFIIPLLDARRMEVYSKIFDNQLNSSRETAAEIIEEHSFLNFLKNGRAILIGSGAAKCQDVIANENIAYDLNLVPSAKDMSQLSYDKFLVNDFEDVAYFEPYYLKDFILQKPKKKKQP